MKIFKQVSELLSDVKSSFLKLKKLLHKQKEKYCVTDGSV